MHVFLFERSEVWKLKAYVSNILEGLGFIRVFREYGVACLSQCSALE
jgi:hypothetical protein